MLLGECEPIQSVAYIGAQLVGATLGSLLLWGSVSTLDEGRGDATQAALVGSPAFGLGANGLNSALNQGNGFLLEFMGTLLLCVTVVMTAVHKKSLAQGIPHMAPLAIGFAVFLAHIVLVPFTGCGINPARTFGPALVNSFAGAKVWDDAYWIYFAGPFTASVVAAAIFKFVFAEENEEAQGDEQGTHEDEPVKDVPEVAAGGDTA